MAGAADLLVDLEAALQLRLIEGAEHAGEAPFLAWRLRLFRLLLGQRKTAGERQREGGRGKGCDIEAGHRRLPLGSVADQA